MVGWPPARGDEQNYKVGLKVSGKLSEMLPADQVGDAYRVEHAWQYRRLQELLDQLEKEKDAIRAERFAFRQERLAWGEMAAAILSECSKSILEKSLSQQFDEDERKRKRREKFRTTGFDVEKAVKE